MDIDGLQVFDAWASLTKSHGGTPKKQNIQSQWDFRFAVERALVTPTNPQRWPALGPSRSRFIGNVNLQSTARASQMHRSLLSFGYELVADAFRPSLFQCA
jgi:hypothetical protein